MRNRIRRGESVLRQTSPLQEQDRVRHSSTYRLLTSYLTSNSFAGADSEKKPNYPEEFAKLSEAEQLSFKGFLSDRKARLKRLVDAGLAGENKADYAATVKEIAQVQQILGLGE